METLRIIVLFAAVDALGGGVFQLANNREPTTESLADGR
jgi:hypothetical protein